MVDAKESQKVSNPGPSSGKGRATGGAVNKDAEGRREPPKGNSGGGNPTNGENVRDKKLNQLRQDIAQNDGQVQDITNKLKVQNKDRSVLEGLDADIDKIISGYESKLQSLTDQKNDLVSYSQKKTAMILTAVGGDKNKVDQIIRTYDEETANLEKAMAAKREEVEQANNEHERTQRTLDQQLHTINEAKGYQKGLDDKLRLLDGLRTEIEKEEVSNAPNKYNIMYYSMIRFNQVLCGKNDACSDVDPRISTRKQLEDRLNSAWSNVYNAMQAVRITRERLDAASSALSQLEQTVQNRQSERNAQIMEKIRAL